MKISAIYCAWSLFFGFITGVQSLLAQEADSAWQAVNTKYLETRPFISPSGKQLYFSRNGDPHNVGGKTDEQDLWVADLSIGSDPVIRNLGPIVNSRGLDALISLSHDENELFTFTNDTKAPINRFRKVEGAWKQIEKIRIKNFYNLSEFIDMFYSTSEEVILMAVKRNESVGGQDLFISVKTESKEWSVPVGLGPSINTAKDDFAPFLAADGRSLFYCSNAEGGEGRADIYYTYRLDDTWTNWSPSVNLGSTINSPDEEVYVSVSPDFKYIFFDQYHPDKIKLRDIQRRLLPPGFGPQEKLPKVDRVGRLDTASTTVIAPKPPPATMMEEASFVQYDIPLRHKLNKYVSGDFIFTTLYQYQTKMTQGKYSGIMSAPADANDKLLGMLTANAMFRLWKGNEILISPEIQRGRGIGRGEGFGAYPNAVFAFPQVRPYIARAQIRQYFYFKNGPLKKYNITLGRWIIQDMTDENAYSNDPQCDFMNFSHTMSSAWDAATTAYGFTHGIAQSFIFDKTTVNVLANTHASEAGGEKTDWDIKNAYGLYLQYIRKFTIAGKTGKLRLLGFYNRYNGGDLSQYYINPETGKAEYDSLHGYNDKLGGGIDISYDWSANCGLFLRYSADDGKHEDFGYTQCDGSLNAGAYMSLKAIKRPDDRFGICASINTLGKGQQKFLKDGGYGFMLGDGNLNYKPESAFETFYTLNFLTDFYLTLDYQYILNIGYNADRGNAHYLAVRFTIDLQY
jgi:Carbohydrate-selective porin, OprB family/WD40-like Beta Propeller Repeat